MSFCFETRLVFLFLSLSLLPVVNTRHRRKQGISMKRFYAKDDLPVLVTSYVDFCYFDVTICVWSLTMTSVSHLDEGVFVLTL